MLNLDFIKKKHNKAISSADLSKAETSTYRVNKSITDLKLTLSKIDLLREDKVITKPGQILDDRIIIKPCENISSQDTIFSDNYLGVKDIRQQFSVKEARLNKQKVRDFKSEMFDMIEKLEAQEDNIIYQENQSNFKLDLESLKTKRRIPSKTKIYLSTNDQLFAPFAEIFNTSDSTTQQFNVNTRSRTDRTNRKISNDLDLIQKTSKEYNH